MPPSPAAADVLRRVTLRTREGARLTDFHRAVLQLPPGLIELEVDARAPVAPPQAPGLFHLALAYPQVEAWAAAVRRTLAAGLEFYGASDHAVSWAAYFADPDGQGLELAWDTPPQDWPWQGSQIRMVSRPLPLRSLLATLPEPTPDAAPPRLGHLHLQLSDLRDAHAYTGRLDLRVTQADYPGARFLARGDYHHHLAVNTWRVAPGTQRPAGAVGLVGWEMSAGAAPAGEWIDPHGHRVRLV
ncbi:MAG: glyoxalase [Verrucomicrobia bacterium]|nr:glyoxalase [Verrucomicrobiota bacterium]